MILRKLKLLLRRISMKENKIKDWIQENYPDAIVMDGFDDAIIGICQRYGFNEPVIAYDKNKVIKILMDDGMKYEKAIEFWEFNQIGSWIGEKTPVFIETPESLS